MPVHRGNIGEVVLNAWNDARCTNIECGGQARNQQESVPDLDRLAVQAVPRSTMGATGTSSSGPATDGNRDAVQAERVALRSRGMQRVGDGTRFRRRRSKPLQFIAQCHWQIESEFSRGNTRDIVIDMSKLVMGSAENKLFIAAHRGVREKDILEQCSQIAGVLRRAGVFRLRFPPGRLERRKPECPSGLA